MRINRVSSFNRNHLVMKQMLLNNHIAVEQMLVINYLVMKKILINNNHEIPSLQVINLNFFSRQRMKPFRNVFGATTRDQFSICFIVNQRTTLTGDSVA